MSRPGLIAGGLAALAVTGVFLIGMQGKDNPAPSTPVPSPSPTVPAVTVYLPNCEDGDRQPGVSCVTFDEGLLVISNDQVSMALPVKPVQVG